MVIDIKSISICKVRFPMVFWYIEGTNPKIYLFKFLCMACRSRPIQMCIGLYEVRSLINNGIISTAPVRIVFLRLRPVFRVVVYSVSHRYHSHTLRYTNSIYLNVFISFSVKPVIITLTITSLLLCGVLPFLCLLTVDFDWKWQLTFFCDKMLSEMLVVGPFFGCCRKIRKLACHAKQN